MVTCNGFIGRLKSLLLPTFHVIYKLAVWVKWCELCYNSICSPIPFVPSRTLTTSFGAEVSVIVVVASIRCHLDRPIRAIAGCRNISRISCADIYTVHTHTVGNDVLSYEFPIFTQTIIHLVYPQNFA